MPIKGAEGLSRASRMTTVHKKGSPVLRWMRAKVVEIFGADLRSLAALRIVLAVLVLADLANRATDLTAHYTDEGIMPRTVLLEEGVINRWAFSLNLMNGGFFFQALLFGVATLAALALIVGYRTRLMTIVVWVVLLSIQWRNPLLSGAGEPFLRVLLFWGMFLPLGAYWSVDRLLKAAPQRLPMRLLSLATVGLFLQIAFVYWFTVLQRSGQEWRTDGTALYYALSLDQIVTPVGAYLYQFPELLKMLTFATIGLEAFGPFLLFCPFFTGPVRTAAVLAFMSLHFGIWLTMDIGIFPWVSAFCMVCFLPSWFWNKVTKLRAVFPEPPNIARRLLPLRARLSAIVDVGQPFTSGTVSYRSGKNQPGSITASPVAVQEALRVRGVRMWRDKWRGKTWSAVQDTTRRGMVHDGSAKSPLAPAVLRSSLLTNFAAAFLLLYIFCWNLTTVSTFTMPAQFAPPWSVSRAQSVLEHVRPLSR